MSDSDYDDELQEKLADFQSEHGGKKPDATQFAKYAGIKYSQASRFLKGAKSSAQPSGSRGLPQHVKWIPADPVATQPRAVSKSVTSSSAASTKKVHKPRKNSRPCRRYQLDMLGAEFGACKCGFSRAAHNAYSSADEPEEEEEEPQQEEEYQLVEQQTQANLEPEIDQEVNDYAQSYAQQQHLPPPAQAQQEDNETVRAMEEVIQRDKAEINELNNTVQQLQQQLIAMQQEINKSFQEKEALKQQVNRLSEENQRLRQNQNQEQEQPRQDDYIEIQQAYQPQVEVASPTDQEIFNYEPEVASPKACKNYQLDMLAAEFGACKCGFPRGAHS